jgi:hypothetical protein
VSECVRARRRESNAVRVSSFHLFGMTRGATNGTHLLKRALALC